MHFIADYLPLADEWGVWDNQVPPPTPIAGSSTHAISDVVQLLTATKLMERAIIQPDAMTQMVLEAGRVATAKMLDHYKRMGIRVTPQMTLASGPKKRVRKPKA